jgi:uncharacterized protein YoaH (UPF0181 family)
MRLKSSAEELAIIAQEISAEAMQERLQQDWEDKDS